MKNTVIATEVVPSSETIWLGSGIHSIHAQRNGNARRENLPGEFRQRRQLEDIIEDAHEADHHRCQARES